MSKAAVASKSSIDWVTVTTDIQRSGYNWLEIYNVHAKRTPGLSKTVRMHGFVGLRCNGMTWAHRQSDERFMMVCSGALAHDMWRKLVPSSSKVTRLDLCCDVWLKVPQSDLVDRSFRVPGTGVLDRKIKYTKFTGISPLPGTDKHSAGQTIYVGSRSSDQMGRMYDKGVQSKQAGPGSWFRYEVELKGARAIEAAMKLQQRTIEEPGILPELLRASVYDWFLGRAIVPVFDRNSSQSSISTRSFSRVQTDHKKLAWLSTQVRPTVAYLIEAGLGEEVMSALGLKARGDRMEI